MAGDERLTIGQGTGIPGQMDRVPLDSKPAAVAREAREVADLVLGAVPSGILVCNVEGEIVLANPAAARPSPASRRQLARRNKHIKRNAKTMINYGETCTRKQK